MRANDSRIRYVILTIILAAILGGLVGWYIRNIRLFMPKTTSSSASVQVRADSSQYSLINPLLYSENAKSTSAEYKRSLSSFASFIDQENTVE